MEKNFYTIDEVAKILGMHHKTIRKFITEGKLKGHKIGKQWRISGHDLSVFTEDNNVDIKNNINLESEAIEVSKRNNENLNRITVSTVIDINDISDEQQRRLYSMLIALTNSKDLKMYNSTVNTKYDKENKNLKIIVWGNIEFITEMLSYISTITNDNI